MKGLIQVGLLSLLPLLPAMADGPAARSFKECPNCPELVVIPAGDFLMGSPETEHGRFDSEGPQHKVTIHPFALAKYNVSVDEFLSFLKETEYQPAPCSPILAMGWKSPGRGLAYPPGPADSPHQPAICLSWADAMAYIGWLNDKVRLPGEVNGPYRLPSEAEWEYAARGHTATARWWGEEIERNKANCNGCGSGWDNQTIAPVGSFGPNPFGLYDMLGNVWQWTADCWTENYADAPTDGQASTKGDCRKRTIRGGSWSNLPLVIRSAARSSIGVDGINADTSSDVGFRIARTIR